MNILSRWSPLLAFALSLGVTTLSCAQIPSEKRFVSTEFIRYVCPNTDDSPRPFGIAFDSRNRMYMLCGDNSGNNYLFSVSLDGKYRELARMKTNFSGPGIAIDKSDNIIVATGDKLFRISPEGKVEILFDDFVKAGDIKIDPHGNMYVIDFSQYRIFKISPSLERTTWIDHFDGKALEFRTGGIAFDPLFENLVVCDYRDGKVTRYHINADGSAGEVTQLLENQALFCAAYGKEGAITFTDWQHNRIIRLNGDRSTEAVDFPGTPIGIYAGKGEFGSDALYITDNFGVKKVIWQKVE